MTNKNKIAEQILAQLASLQGASHQTITHGDPFDLPRLIPSGDGGTIQISKAIDDLISELAACLKQARPTLSKTMKHEEWRSLVRHTLGPELSPMELTPPFEDTATAVVIALEQRLERQLEAIGDREYAFGATLFSNEDIPPFSIGPVRVERRSDWLERKGNDGDVSPTTRRRLLKIWSGGRVARRKPGREARHETDILDAIAGAPYVVSIRLLGYASHASLDAAATGARLSLACIALLWNDSSKAMQGFRLRYDPPAHRRVTLSFVPGRLTFSSRTRNGLPFGPQIESADWQIQLSDARSLFAAAGEAIAYLVSPDDTAPRADLMKTLSQALLWFNAGCREESDEFAVVNFGSCLDTLSGGYGKVEEILVLLQKRLNLSPTANINSKSDMTFKSAVKLIFSDGRSRISHGTSNRVGHDWSVTRRMAQDLSRFALFACLDHSGSDPAIISAEQLRQ